MIRNNYLFKGRINSHEIKLKIELKIETAKFWCP